MAALPEGIPRAPDAPDVAMPPEDQGWIDRFKSRITEFTQVFTRLKALGPQINQLPDLKPEYQSLVERGNTIQTTIDRVTASINNVVHWLSKHFSERLN